MSMGEGGNMDIRARFLADTSSMKTALSQATDSAHVAAEKITEEFRRAGEFIKSTIGIIGLSTMFEKAVDSASQLEQVQAVQANLLTNQGLASQYNLSMTKQTFDQQKAAGNWSAAFYSKMLANQSNYLSVQTGVNRAQITQAQTLALTNTDIAKLVSTGPMVKGALGAAGQPLNGIRQNMQLMITDAINLSEVMGGGHGGSVSSSARMLTRTLANPMQRMSAMARYGFTLSQSEQMRIKTLESTNGLYAAQQQLLVDINNHVKNTAQVATSPIEMLKNDFQIIYTTIGQGLLPFFKALATSLGTVVTALMPLFQSAGDALGQVLGSLGEELGTIFQVIKPLVDLFVNNLLPVLLQMITPFFKLANDIFTPLAKALDKIIGTGSGMKTLSGIFSTMGAAVSKSLMVGVKAIADAFTKMVKNGQLNAMLQGFVKVIATLEPILPAVATAVANLMVALAPLFIAAGPALVKILQIWANLLVALTPAILIIINAISKLIGWITGNKGLTEAIAILAAAWFTRNLFLTPIKMAMEGITLLSGKILSLGGTLRKTGSLFKQFFQNRGMTDAKGNPMTAGSRLGRLLNNRADISAVERAAKIKAYEQKAEQGGFMAAHWAKRAEELKKKTSYFEKIADSNLGKTLFKDAGEEAKKGRWKGLFKGFFGVAGNLFGVSGAGQASDNADNQLSATNNLIDAINNLISTIQSGGMGGGGGNSSNPLKTVENDVKKGKSLIDDLKKGRGLASKAKNLVSMGKNLVGRLFGGGGAEALGGEAATGAEVAGTMEAGAALGPETLGVSVAVAAATAAYIKWHKQINHFVSTTAHHLWNGAKDVGKWASKEAGHLFNGVKDVAKSYVKFSAHVGHAVLNVGKHLVTGAANIAKGAAHLVGGAVSAIGGFFGGLFGGGGSSKPSTPNIGQLNKMTFTGGALNVHIMGVQAGRALNGRASNAVGRGETVVHIAPGAFTIQVHGNMDKTVGREVKTYVDDQFKELHRQLRSLGR